ncbi:hypothetical protein Cni_G16293 [Canna indica]|uniref:Uncharacterized protein n=1 Tax=Canna indica TaxID=4628 RepID=A0AAQ3KFT6_9LILI|nr:hypothetical protein Cni_G16293 [Canna indica]
MQNMRRKFDEHKYELKRSVYSKYETTEERLEHVLDGIEPNDWKAFVEYHDRETTQDKFKALTQELNSSTPTTEDEIYRQVVESERHGRTRSYGLGPTPTTVFGTTPGRTELVSQLRIANTQNAELKTKIDELEKKMDDAPGKTPLSWGPRPLGKLLFPGAAAPRKTTL